MSFIKVEVANGAYSEVEETVKPMFDLEVRTYDIFQKKEDGGFVYVASMVAYSPQEVYGRTQHGADPWDEAPGITVASDVDPEDIRSTSVGDIFIVSEGEEFLVYTVEVEGFKLIRGS